jgi:thymidylate kinase
MLIAVDGPDGAGKSTHVALLADWLAARGVPCEVVSKWQVLDPDRQPESRFLRGTNRRELQRCVAEMPSPARAMFIMWLYAQTAARAVRLAADGVVLVDGYWMKHAAAELVYGTDPRAVDGMLAAMPAVDAVFHLDVDPVEALRRRQGELTPYECGLDPTLDPARFLLAQRAIRTLLTDRARRGGWHYVPPGPVEQMQAELRAQVWALLAPTLVPAAAEGPGPQRDDEGAAQP